MREPDSVEDSAAVLEAPDVRPETAPPAPAGRLQRIVFAVGSVGLLTAAAVDSIAVLGRHAGFAFLGSIELVQVVVVLIGSSAMIGATIVGSHAAVHIITERLSSTALRRAARVSNLLAALTFVLFAIGSAWVAADLWGGFERTELLAIPLRWFRLVWVVAAVVIALLFARAALARTPR